MNQIFNRQARIQFNELGVVFVILATLMTSCKTSLYQDISDTVSTQALAVQQGDYKSVSWLKDDLIAFIYRPDELRVNGLDNDFRLDILEVTSGNIETLPQIPLPSGCFPRPSGIHELTKLPNGSLGLVFRCHSDNGISSTLYLLDKNKNDFIAWENYPKFLATSFSFDPDMTQFIQENGIGGTSNELYLVNSEKIITKLLPDFKRARSPAWSPDGKTIAFAGTKANSENTTLNTWNDIGSLLYYPWDIYLMDADGSNVRVLLPLVGNIYGLKWSPINGNSLLFGGTAFDDMEGIWLLDTADGKIKRLWDENTYFDWSADGSKIVVLTNNSGNWWEDVVIIDLAK
ncbi:MAG: PD40 domain-containing protein [Chloroflexi bacterium]|nr:PD40 domain-containing protein [Chloroflexota bacterium]